MRGALYGRDGTCFLSLKLSLLSFLQSWIKQTGLRNERRKGKARVTEFCLHSEVFNWEILKVEHIHCEAFGNYWNRENAVIPGSEQRQSLLYLTCFIVRFWTSGLKHFPGDIEALEWGPGWDKGLWVCFVWAKLSVIKKKKSNGSFLCLEYTLMW